MQRSTQFFIRCTKIRWNTDLSWTHESRIVLQSCRTCYLLYGVNFYTSTVILYRCRNSCMQTVVPLTCCDITNCMWTMQMIVVCIWDINVILYVKAQLFSLYEFSSQTVHLIYSDCFTCTGIYHNLTVVTFYKHDLYIYYERRLGRCDTVFCMSDS